MGTIISNFQLKKLVSRNKFIWKDYITVQNRFRQCRSHWWVFVYIEHCWNFLIMRRKFRSLNQAGNTATAIKSRQLYPVRKHWAQLQILFYQVCVLCWAIDFKNSVRRPSKLVGASKLVQVRRSLFQILPSETIVQKTWAVQSTWAHEA